MQNFLKIDLLLAELDPKAQPDVTLFAAMDTGCVTRVRVFLIRE